MKIKSAYTIPKEAKSYEDNEDSYAFSERGDIICLCDGASQSFSAQDWANLVSNNFVSVSRDFSEDEVLKIIKEHVSGIDLANMSWTQMSSFEKGSFTTVLRLKEGIDGLAVESIGDCMICYHDLQNRIQTFPYLTEDEFSKNPETISSRIELNAGLKNKIQTTKIKRGKNSSNFRGRRKRGYGLSLSGKSTSMMRVRPSSRRRVNSSIVLLMTDALGQWLCKDKNVNYQKLISIRSSIEFEQLILGLRKKGLIRIDDTTLLTITF